MPYISAARKEILADKSADKNPVMLSAGELTYKLTLEALEPFPTWESLAEKMRNVVSEYLTTRPQGDPNFQTYADCLGALEATWREYQRRMWRHGPSLGVTRACQEVQAALYRERVAPYEDSAILRNGDLEEYRQNVSVAGS